MLNLHHLRYFFVCAKKKSITHAAASLRISQPSLSLQIKTFEDSIGRKLFIRSAKSIELTSYGRELYAKCVDLFDNYDHLLEFLNEKTEGKTNRITIGVSDEIERPFIADIVSRIYKRSGNKNIVYKIFSNSHNELVNDFLDSKIDLLLTNRKVPDRILKEQFNYPVLLVSSKDRLMSFKYNESKVQQILNFVDEQLVVPSANILLGEESKNFFRKNNIAPNIVFESNILSCNIRAIKEGVGCGFLPLPYIYQERKKGSLSVMGPKNGFWQHQISLYYKKTNELSIMNYIIEYMKEYVV